MGHRILLVGSGGREHALARKLLESPLCERLIVAPGNPGIASGGEKVTCAPAATNDELLALARAERVDLVVCGPEAPLAAGLGDLFTAAGLRFFGPSRAAAEVESSKAFAKQLMRQAGVPTAAFGTFQEIAAAEAFIDVQPGNVVVKADGLCAGKGVVVASSKAEAKGAVRAALGERVFGDAGARVVIEERLTGREVSMMALVDGEQFALLASAEDHKAVYDGDQGPNTGGMGAYCPSPLVDDRLAAKIGETIFGPTIRALVAAGRPFRGCLFGGLMLTPDRGPVVIEWNCRFGDPETQVVLARLEDDLVPWLVGVADGRLPAGAPRWAPGVSVCVVLAAGGYPGKVRTGDEIVGLGPDGQIAGGADALVLHAGTRHDGARLVTAGGRVLGVTARGSTLDEARGRAYTAVEKIRWPGMHYRRDIGQRGRTT